MPIVGRLPGCSNGYIAVGHGAVGIQLSPVQHESLQCYVYRLLGSRIGAPSVSGGGDEFALVEKMKRGLAASARARRVS